MPNLRMARVNTPFSFHSYADHGALIVRSA